MSIEDDLGFTKEQLDRFTAEVTPELKTRIERAFESGNAKAVVEEMAQADLYMGLNTFFPPAGAPN